MPLIRPSAENDSDYRGFRCVVRIIISEMLVHRLLVGQSEGEGKTKRNEKLICVITLHSRPSGESYSIERAFNIILTLVICPLIVSQCVLYLSLSSFPRVFTQSQDVTRLARANYRGICPGISLLPAVNH